MSDSSLARPTTRWQTLRAVLHAILGAPDYDRYVAHARACHPDRPPMTRDEFARDRLAARYDRPGSRCC